MSDSQKFISRNRAPRVQIEYDVELYGATKKVQLPFVMGVMSDLSGKSEVPKGSLAERKFLEIDVDNFDARMKAMKPRAAFSVPNTLTGEGNLSVDLVFEKMSDFSPAAIARKVEPLRKLLEARTQLSNLMAYMDGKAGAEALIERLVANPEQLRALALGAGTPDSREAAFEAVKAAAEAVPEAADESQDILAAMAATAPEEDAPQDTGADVLAAMAAHATETEAPDTSTDDTLAALADSVTEPEPEEDRSADVLASLAASAPDGAGQDTSTAEASEAADTSADVLAALAAEAVEPEAAEDTGTGILAEMAAQAVEDGPSDDGRADILANLAETAPEDTPGDTSTDDTLAALAATETDDGPAGDDSADILAGLAENAPEEDGAEDDLKALLGEMAEAAPDVADEGGDTAEILADMALDQPDESGDEGDGLDDLLADMAADAPAEDAGVNNADDLLADLAADAPDDAAEESDGIDDLLADMAADAGDDDIGAEDDLEALLGELAEAAPDVAEEGGDEGDGLDDLLADMAAEADEDESGDDGLDALLSAVAETESDAQDDDLDALLADVGGQTDGEDDLDALLAGVSDDGEEDGLDLDSLLGDGETQDESGGDDLDSLLAMDSDDGDLDSLLADNGDDDSDPLDTDDAAAAPPPKPKKPAFRPDFGSMSAPRLEFEPGARRKFRLAVLGDFSGRGNRGALETGEALGKRKAFKIDFDTMEDVIARFRTTLTLPLGNDGSAVAVELNELDDLHPDELFENVELFNELNMLRRDLKSGRNFEQNVARMQAWGGAFGDFRALSKKRSKGAAAPADLRLSEFQTLIGDTTPKPEASAASDLISRIIGPHVVATEDNGAEEMIAAVDKALSTAMSSVLHHPDFQAIEAAWRSLELLGRRVEASAELEVVVYDLSVEEFTADLAAQDDVSQSGLYDMLVEKPMQDESAGPISAVIGLYTWEETPTHAELLARMARISAQMDAPFISAISTGFMGTKPEDRHPLVKKTWDALAEMPEAKYLGLATPRFMLRMPYGKKTEPLDRFDYEEFNIREGMRSMLLANPALLVAVLLAETKARQGGDMSLGSIMSLNDMPFHYMTDQYGDQVALPCTERLLSVRGAAEVVARGFMPVLSVQGQNIVKLGSFQAVGGGELLGIWAGDAAREMKSGAVRMETSVGISSSAKQVGAPPKAAKAGAGDDDGGDDGFDSDTADDDLDLDLGGDDDLDLDLDLDLGDDGDDGMDDLLAGFADDDEDADSDDDGMDEDLAALLGDL